MNITRRQFLVRYAGGAALVTGGAILGVGCGSKAPDPNTPPSITYGGERCFFCTMSIDDERFAAAWRASNTPERHFDDIGCMVDAYRRDGPTDARLWVHDYRSKAWLDGGAASYVVASSVKSPMAYGVAAFVSASDATAAVPTAKAQTWSDLLTTVERKG